MSSYTESEHYTNAFELLQDKMASSYNELSEIHEFPPTLDIDDLEKTYHTTRANLQPSKFKIQATCCCCEVDYPNISIPALKMHQPIYSSDISIKDVLYKLKWKNYHSLPNTVKCFEYFGDASLTGLVLNTKGIIAPDENDLDGNCQLSFCHT